MKKVVLSTIAALTLLTGSFTITQPLAEASSITSSLKFKDVPSTHWAASAIASAVKNGYMKGYTDGSFKPSSPITKTEMAVILSRIEGQPTVASGKTFSDVPTWAKSAVSAAVQKGFISVSKYGNKLNANAALTRGEMATWLAQGLAAVHPDFKQALSDVTNTVIPAKEYFEGKMPAAQKNAVAVTMGTGLMSVGSDKSFGVSKTTTRAEVAVLLTRYTNVAKKDPSDLQALNELREIGLTGTNIKTIVPKYVKTPEEKFPTNYDYSKVTDDFSKIRNKELVTKRNYATVKIKNWILVNPYVKGEERSIYYSVFLDEGDKPLRGSYYSFAEFNLSITSASMTQVQAGNLMSSPSFIAAISPNSQSSKEYQIPVTSKITTSRGEFTVKTPIYWGTGLLHFDKSLRTGVSLVSEDGTVFDVIPK
ncbi:MULTISPECIES: S-layer homology domain-containing protein [unclassified Paenibacillus]|uniref:S-layer homology domain-containing protein n=2 Tax=Bacillati TaxID=1783272 RepID=A0ABW3Q3P3_9BACL|nr:MULTISPECIES: S-layer homology domain-containing protein [unclassified Paenibacillus]MCM3130601.1 S-layer homology domain-containing protein [Paenibacillus sp. MER 78]SDX74797.1 S-layer homology domain-containing protein [Paenibacillus sp. PDC88]SFS89989.1 S-layer homology domain-containing protein [Paenibacillus sp. 453mf]